MDKASETGREERGSQRGKRRYEPPEILSEEIFETTALACGKIAGGGAKCNASPKAS